MKQSINRRDFLKLSSAMVIAAGMSGWGLRQFLDNNQPYFLSPKSAPNVILIVLDTVRAKSMSLYGYELSTTPNLSRLAKQGVCFTQAIAPASWTLASHASIFTGQRPFNISADWNSRLDSTYPTLAEVMTQNGYQTVGFSANRTYCTREFGLARGFDIFEDFNLSLGLSLSSVASLSEFTSEKYMLGQMVRENVFKSRKDGEQVRKGFIKWLDHRDKEKPFFAFMNFMDAHDPYISSYPFYSKFTGGKPRFFAPERARYAPDIVTMKELNSAYDGCIAYLDYQLDLLISDLDIKGVLDNTLLIITADHGEHFGDHNLYNHGNSLYMNSLHVPLVMLFPGKIPTDLTINDNVSLISLASTITDLAGIKPVSSFSGESLARFWRGSPKVGIIPSEATIFEWKSADKMIYKRARSLIYNNWHYIRTEGGKDELYDVKRDADEQNNLADSEQSKDILTFFRSSNGEF